MTYGHTSFYAVSVFGELGAHALRSFQKGERIILNGRLRLREWETESKRGVSADVTAEAIGHDLRWGISRFERTPRPESSNAPAGPAVVAAASAGRTAAAAAAHSDADGWALPGGESPEAATRDETESGAAADSSAEPVDVPF